jgi:hypothetical protein
MNKALVAGALGVTGRALVNHLVSLGNWEVIALSRRRPEFQTAESLRSMVCSTIPSGMLPLGRSGKRSLTLNMISCRTQQNLDNSASSSGSTRKRCCFDSLLSSRGCDLYPGEVTSRRLRVSGDRGAANRWSQSECSEQAPCSLLAVTWRLRSHSRCTVAPEASLISNRGASGAKPGHIGKINRRILDDHQHIKVG